MQRAIAFTAIVLALFSSGCGDGRPKRVPVSGQVLIDGKPLASGLIRIVPEEGRMSAGDLDSEGRFTMSCYAIGDGVLPGTHRVEVAGFKTINDITVRWFAPKKYADYQTSGLEETIDGPTDSLIIRLSWDGGHPFDEVEGVVREITSKSPQPEASDKPRSRFGRGGP